MSWYCAMANASEFERKGSLSNFNISKSIYLVIVVALLLPTGCPNPNSFVVPRTVPAGKVQHTIALEGIGFKPARYQSDDGSSTAQGVTAPSYALRVGLFDGFDVAGHLYNSISPGLEIKYNPIRSRLFDVALNPGVQFGKQDERIWHLAMPIGWNALRGLTVIATPGASIVDSEYGWVQYAGPILAEEQVLGRFSLGVYLRMTPNVAVHPAMTLLRDIDGEDTIFLGGVGFHLGRLPEYPDTLPSSKSRAAPSPPTTPRSKRPHRPHHPRR